MRIARKLGAFEPASIRDCSSTDRVLIVPSGHTASSIFRTSMDLEDVSGTTLHFLVEIRSEKGIVDIEIQPVLRVVNLLPCQLECQFGEVMRADDSRVANSRPVIGRATKNIAKTEAMKIASGKEGACTAVNPWFKPHVSLRVPGYRWSQWQRIVNRKASSNTWRPADAEEDWYFTSKGDADFAEEFKTIVRFERNGKAGDRLILVLSVECGHCPILRVYAQYWIIDKTGFGCRFTDGFTDLMSSAPDGDTSRRSHLLPEEAKEPDIRSDMSIPGHQWSIGMSGMSLFFSKREKLALSIETGAGVGRFLKSSHSVRSKWVSPLDISNVMPKTVFSVDELGGPRRFELAISATVCPGIFARTKMISLLPRYQIVNLLRRELVVAQDGCLKSETLIPSQSAVPFHWEKGALAPKVRIGAPSAEEKDSGVFGKCWTNGRLRLDRVGITSLRLPTDSNLAKIPMVVQAEVRLATKDQSSAVVVVIWSANEKSNPLYVLRNRTVHTILCRQPLQDERTDADGADNRLLSSDGCTAKALANPGFECGTEIGPMILAFLGLDKKEEFVWVLKPSDVVCFGFDDPEKPHILEWTFVSKGALHFNDRCKKACLEVNAMGSASTLSLGNGRQIRCQIGAEHSTKVIEFIELGDSSGSSHSDIRASDGVLSALKTRGLQYQHMLESRGKTVDGEYDHLEDDEDVAFSFRVDVPALSISVVDNADARIHGREILLARFEKIFFAFSQTREGYHEFEVTLLSFQVDNHVQKSIHPVLVSR
jgi:SHR-binding domain of vacuolar-sorting associated protein 13